MKYALALCGTFIAGAALALVVAAPWQDAKAKDKGAAGAEMSPEMMAAWTKYATPGPEHKELAALAGSWTVTSECWMTPDGPSEKGSGTSTMKMVMGDRFLQEDFSGTTPMGPFHGMGLLGFDNGTQKYNHVWLDDMSTGVMYSTGEKKGDALSFKGEMYCPMVKGLRTMRFECRKAGENERIMEMYAQDPGQPEFKTAVFHYKRGSATGAR